MRYYYKVAVNTPFNRSVLTYSSSSVLPKGGLYWAPLGKRKEKACVLEKIKEPTDQEYEIKDLGAPYDENILLSEEYLKFISWCAKYYYYPLGQLIFDVLPKLMKKPLPLVVKTGEGMDLAYDLGHEQKNAIETISRSLGKYEKFLLHGVTGSGKTSVYIKLIEKNTAMGKNSLLLIPEINLTPALIETLEKYLSLAIYSYHSALTNSQRYGLWLALKEKKEPFVVVAVRSGIFLPMSNLGLVIVDEEHDSSYKQEDRCPYHARDLALKLATLHKCPAVLGSATPSFESYAWALDNQKNYLRLTTRASGVEMPAIDVVDRRNVGKLEHSEELWPFSMSSLETIREKVESGEQVIVFVNRLGYATYVQCRSCGYQFLCKNCALSLKYFKNRNELSCPTCDYREPMPLSCPACGNLKLLQKGFGTERLENIVKSKFPQLKVGRFDRDVIRNFKQMNETLESFNKGEFDVLIGTQMLSKGHNFPNVNYVLVLGVDSQLNFPDFRSSENAYQLITQISGRAGRFGKHGRVVIESYTPDNKIFQLIKNYDDETFYKEELSLRRKLDLPPYSRLAAIYLVASRQDLINNFCQEVGQVARDIKERHFKSVEIIGIRPALVEKRENKYSWTMLFRSNDTNDLHNFIESLVLNMPKNNRVSSKIDMDPQHIY